MSLRNYDPRGKIFVNLTMFDDVPILDRPVFEYRRLSCAEYDRLADIWDDHSAPEGCTIEQAKDHFKSIRDELLDIAAVGLLGWKNQVNVETGESEAFVDGKSLGTVLNYQEARQLIERRLAGAQISHDDKKKLESPA